VSPNIYDYKVSREGYVTNRADLLCIGVARQDKNRKWFARCYPAVFNEKEVRVISDLRTRKEAVQALLDHAQTHWKAT
jgi:hypothetical protein